MHTYLSQFAFERNYVLVSNQQFGKFANEQLSDTCRSLFLGNVFEHVVKSYLSRSLHYHVNSFNRELKSLAYHTLAELVYQDSLGPNQSGLTVLSAWNKVLLKLVPRNQWFFKAFIDGYLPNGIPVSCVMNQKYDTEPEWLNTGPLLLEIKYHECDYLEKNPRRYIMPPTYYHQCQVNMTVLEDNLSLESTTFLFNELTGINSSHDTLLVKGTLFCVTNGTHLALYYLPRDVMYLTRLLMCQQVFEKQKHWLTRYFPSQYPTLCKLVHLKTYAYKIK